MEKVGRRLICIHRRRPIPGNFPSVSWANPFRVLSVCGTFNVRICAKLGPAHPASDDPSYFTCEEKMERTVDWTSPKTGEM